MKPLRVFSCIRVDVESHAPMRFSWKDIAEIHLAFRKKKITFFNHLFIWFIVQCLCSKLEDDLAIKKIPPKYGVRSLCLLTSLAISAWEEKHRNIYNGDLNKAIFSFLFKRDYTVKDKDWLIAFLNSRGVFFDDTKKKATIILSTLDNYDMAACDAFIQYFNDASSKKEYHPIITASIEALEKIVKADISKFSIALFENFDNALPVWEEHAARYGNGNSLKYWAAVKQKLVTVIEKLHDKEKRQYIVEDVEAFIDAANEAGAAWVASVIAEKARSKLPQTIVDARVVEVAPSAGKSLRTAMKDPGGRPKKTEGGAKVMTQGEMAVAFGEPCNEDMISNWEAYERTSEKRGAIPFGFAKDNEKIIYSAELRTNPTPENTKRLTALISEFQSRHRLKTAIGEKAKTIHCRSAESLYQAQKKHGA